MNLYDGGTRIARVQQDEALLDVALGREFGTWGELRFGVRRGSGKQKLETGVPAAILPDDFDRGEAFAHFTVDTLDSIYFPREGNFLSMEWVTSKQDLGATADFDQFVGNFFTAKTFGRHTLAFGLRYGSTTEGTAPPWSLFEIGGFWDLSGYAQDELSGQNVGLLLASYYRRIGNLGPAATVRGNHFRERQHVGYTQRDLAGQLSQRRLALGRRRHADRPGVPRIWPRRRRPRQLLHRDRQCHDLAPSTHVARLSNAEPSAHHLRAL